MTSGPLIVISFCSVIAPLVAAELERGQAVAVDHAVDIRRVGVLARPDHPAGLAVRIHALAEELDARLQDEVAGHALPDELELVALGPHVHAAGGERVFLGDGVVGRRARRSLGDPMSPCPSNAPSAARPGRTSRALPPSPRSPARRSPTPASRAPRVLPSRHDPPPGTSSPESCSCATKRSSGSWKREAEPGAGWPEAGAGSGSRKREA